MDPVTYCQRREHLCSKIEGAILFLGASQAPRNYPSNVYPFRQDSHFLYYVGTDQPDLAVLIYPDRRTMMFGNRQTPDHIVWNGLQPTIENHCIKAGIHTCIEMNKLQEELNGLQSQNVDIHYLPPYRAEQTLTISKLLNIPWQEVAPGASQQLAREIVEQRAVKSEREVAEMERALNVAAKMYDTALSIIAPGKKEVDIAGAMQGVALIHDMPQAFLPIVTVNGQVLHNNDYSNTLERHQMVLIDAGVEAPPHYYTSDTTRTFPVSGTFDSRQREIYELVLKTQLTAINTASPNVSNPDVHKAACKTITQGLMDLGLMKGNVDDAVENGAHALFFPHGIGHMMGIDVHDMEDLGDVVGYPEGKKRSKQFGLAFLRLAKSLKPGFVVTIEPGIYFIPTLIDKWKTENLHTDFINYDKVETYKNFGGIRIEDDIVITDTGCRVLGPPIPKHVDDIERRMKS